MSRMIGKLRMGALTVAFAALVGCGEEARTPAAVTPTPLLSAAQAEARSEVPFTRTIALDKSGVVVEVAFDLPPPEPGAKPEVMIGIRLSAASATEMLQRSSKILQGGLPASISLQQRVEGMWRPVALVRSSVDLRERLPIGSDGYVPGVTATSVDEGSLRRAGLLDERVSYDVLGFARLEHAKPGSYLLRVELKEARPDLSGYTAELLVAYHNKAKP